MNVSKLVLRLLDLHPKLMKSTSLSDRTELKVLNQEGTPSISIQNFSRLFEL